MKMRKKLNCIMLVDDDQLDNRFHQIIIEGMDITEIIHVAENGLQAIKYLKQEDRILPELIFLDINMPKMNGWEFLEAYKDLEESQKSQIVIMMLTTSLNPSDKAKAQKISEITGFRVKPLSEEMLTEILGKYFPDNL